MRFVDRLLYGLAFAPFLTDWLDTGHLPAGPREFLTEIVLGALIAGGVWRLRREAEHLRALALTDGLTGLGNRRRFDLDVDREVARAHRLGTPLALAYVDIDAFKAINDDHGHAAGDRVLRHVARQLADGTRAGVDFAYRLGGDEFAVLLTGEEARGARQALARVTRLPPLDGLPPVHTSIGVVDLGPGEAPAELVARADAHMYAVKRAAAPARAISARTGTPALAR